MNTAAAVSLERPPGRELFDAYRREFAASGVFLPLAVVPASPAGLLKQLPPPPAGRTGWPWTIETPPPADPAAWPRLGIVIPSFRQGAYIEEAIRSVLLQNQPNLELIVIDAGSTDETPAILDKYRPWLSFVRSAPDRGQGHAINLGLSLASGDAVGWLNSDDLYLPGALQRVCLEFRGHAIEFVYGDAVCLLEDSGEFYYSPAPFAAPRYCQFGGLVPSHAAFWRRDISQPLWEDLKCNVDGELWFRLLPGARRCHLPVPLGLLRSQAQAKSVSDRWKQAWREDDAKIWAIYGRPPAPRSWQHYEYRFVQRLYTWWTARRHRAVRMAALAPCRWTVKLL